MSDKSSNGLVIPAALEQTAPREVQSSTDDSPSRPSRTVIGIGPLQALETPLGHGANVPSAKPAVSSNEGDSDPFGGGLEATVVSGPPAAVAELDRRESVTLPPGDVGQAASGLPTMIAEAPASLLDATLRAPKSPGATVGSIETAAPQRSDHSLPDHSRATPAQRQSSATLATSLVAGAQRFEHPVARKGMSVGITLLWVAAVAAALTAIGLFLFDR